MFTLKPGRILVAAILGASIAPTASADVVIGSAYTLHSPASNLEAPPGYTSNLQFYAQSPAAASFNTKAINNAGEVVLAANQTSGSYTEAVLFDPTYASNGIVSISPKITYFGGYKDTVKMISSAGAVAGYSTDSSSNSYAWEYIPSGTAAAGATSVLANTGDLAGSVYHYTTTSGSVVTSHFNTQSLAAGGAGWTVGTASRYANSTSNGLGTDAWIENPGNITSSGVVTAGPTIIPLITANPTAYQATVTISGATYTYQTSLVVAVNASGTAVGESTRYLGYTSSSSSPIGSFGNDMWMSSGGTTTQIGLIGANTSGTGTFSFTGSSGGPAYESSGTSAIASVYAINSSGQIGGQSTVVSNGASSTQGQYAWVYTPSATPGVATVNVDPRTEFNGATNYISGSYGTYQSVGLTDSNHLVGGGGPPTNTLTALNNSGQASGTSSRAAGGTDMWFFPGITGAASILISPVPTDSTKYSYTQSNGTSTSTFTSMNANGLVAGYTSKYVPNTSTSLGQDAWVYDPSQGKTFVIDADPNLAEYSYSLITYLSDSGIALGYYNTYSGTSNTVTGTYVFAWTDVGGIPTLTTLYRSPTPNGTADANWASLANMLTFGSDGTLYGLGTTNAANGNLPGIFSLTAVVPEPASLGFLGLGAFAFLKRRRR